MRTISFAVAAVCLCLSQAFAQNANYWQSTNGPETGSTYPQIQMLVPSTVNRDVFALAGYDIFRTTDNGATWSVIDSTRIPSATMIGVDAGGVVYATSYSDGRIDSLLLSPDNG